MEKSLYSYYIDAVEFYYILSLFSEQYTNNLYWKIYQYVFKYFKINFFV